MTLSIFRAQVSEDLQACFSHQGFWRILSIFSAAFYWKLFSFDSGITTLVVRNFHSLLLILNIIIFSTSISRENRFDCSHPILLLNFGINRRRFIRKYLVSYSHCELGIPIFENSNKWFSFWFLSIFILLFLNSHLSNSCIKVSIGDFELLKEIPAKNPSVLIFGHDFDSTTNQNKIICFDSSRHSKFQTSVIAD